MSDIEPKEEARWIDDGGRPGDKPVMHAFFAYETMGVGIAHCSPVSQLTRDANPELFAELDRMLDDGRASIDEHGALTFKEDVPDEPIVVQG